MRPAPKAGKIDAKKRLERDIEEIMNNNILLLGSAKNPDDAVQMHELKAQSTSIVQQTLTIFSRNAMHGTIH